MTEEPTLVLAAAAAEQTRSPWEVLAVAGVFALVALVLWAMAGFRIPPNRVAAPAGVAFWAMLVGAAAFVFLAIKTALA